MDFSSLDFGALWGRLDVAQTFHILDEEQGTVGVMVTQVTLEVVKVSRVPEQVSIGSVRNTLKQSSQVLYHDKAKSQVKWGSIFIKVSEA